MSKINPLAGLIANYGDSGDESEEELRANKSEMNNGGAVTSGHSFANASAAVHPAPITHCPWSACYDESSGFTYYWNQQTNAVTWEAPPEYLLALKLAQAQLISSGSGVVSAEEWQLYQQALAEKQTTQPKPVIKPSTKANKKNDSHTTGNKGKNSKFGKKRTRSEDEEEKIELITSYHNSDSDSNDEVDTPVKTPPPLPVTKIQPKPNVHKRPKLKTLEYGPALPPNLNYTVPIGPELPPELGNHVVSSPVNKTHAVKEPHFVKETNALKETNTVKETHAMKEISAVKESSVVKETHAAKEAHTVPETISVKEDKPSKTNDEDSQDETTLLMKLKDKAKLLEKLGGEIPKELQQMIGEETGSGCATPKTDDSLKSNCNIDELLDEIEKKELPKISKAKRADSFEDTKSNNGSSAKSSPARDGTPPLEPRPLFPSFQNIEEAPVVVEVENEEKKVEIADKKVANLYLSDNSERIENVGKKKLRISNSVLPKKEPVYTTKYSQFIEGFSNERVGLGFSKDDDNDHNVETSKNAVSYGNGLVFTKGETLNVEKKEEDLEDMAELVEMKLKYLNQLQPSVLTPVQEMLVQMQTLWGAFRAGALGAAYWRRWAADARRQLAAHERRAAPPGWTCSFQRSEGRYCYRRESDGLVQWEYPATTHTDMDICTTPPHPGVEAKEEVQPPLPPPPLPPPPPAAPSPPAWRARTPPPPAWADPPPPGCDDLPPLPPVEPKQEIGDELASFYSDIAELEKVQSAPHTAPNSPEPVEQVNEKPKEKEREREREKEREREREKDRVREREKEVKVVKKKSKVKISSSVGLKHKSVSNLVAKWQQVAEEISSD